MSAAYAVYGYCGACAAIDHNLVGRNIADKFFAEIAVLFYPGAACIALYLLDIVHAVAYDIAVLQQNAHIVAVECDILQLREIHSLCAVAVFFDDKVCAIVLCKSSRRCYCCNKKNI